MNSIAPSSQSVAVWADKPFPLIDVPRRNVSPDSKSRPKSKARRPHASLTIAQGMVQIHNCLLRALNSIYQQAPYISLPEDVRDFLLLIKLWHDEVHHHHQSEEVMFFPLLKELLGEENIMKENIDQHHEFEPGLTALLKFSQETTVEEYDGHKLRKVIDEFGEVLQRHLKDEIETLLALDIWPDEKVRAAWDQTHDWVLKTCDKTIQLPILMRSHDSTFAPGLEISLPWFLFYIVHYWFARRYSQCWRFLPSTTWGVRRPLRYVGAATKGAGEKA